jgi:fatty-acyl-CoA synthase
MTNILSQVTGPTTIPLLAGTIGQALDEAAIQWSANLALIDRGQNIRLSWATLRERAESLAKGLLSIGLRPGQRIGIWSMNRFEWTLAQFASAKAGLILVTVNPAYRLTELEHALERSGCAAIIFSPAFKTSNYPEMIQSLVPEMVRQSGEPIQSTRLPALRWAIQMGSSSVPGALLLTDIEAHGRSVDETELTKVGTSISPNDAVNIQFTSGTTGAPKGVTLSHRSILNNGYFTGKGIGLGSTDRLCIPVPLYHCFGMVMGNLACLTLGATMVYPGEGFDPVAVLEAVAEERCTALYGVPTMFIAELDHPRFAEFDLESLRTGIMAGSPCPIEIMRKVACTCRK